MSLHFHRCYPECIPLSLGKNLVSGSKSITLLKFFHCFYRFRRSYISQCLNSPTTNPPNLIFQHFRQRGYSNSISNCDTSGGSCKYALVYSMHVDISKRNLTRCTWARLNKNRRSFPRKNSNIVDIYISAQTAYTERDRAVPLIALLFI